MKFLFFFIDLAIVLLTTNLPPILVYGVGAFENNAFGWIGLILLCSALFLFVNIVPGIYGRIPFRYKILAGGRELLSAFLVATLADVGIFVYMLTSGGHETGLLIAYAVTAAVLLFLLFWNGILRTYIVSAALGIELRVLGAVFGLVPVLNIVFLVKIILAVDSEVTEEQKYTRVERERIGKGLCATRYPLLFVHGVFFRDTKAFNYWGRVPAAVEENGGRIYYGGQQSALSVENSAAELAAKIKEICESTGCGKLNVIAHSKGGLDTRYAISEYGCDKYIATLTTVNTPHRGCLFVDKLYDSIPEGARQKMAAAYNGAAKKVGDTAPDFLAAVYDLRSDSCNARNEKIHDSENVFYQSVGSISKNAKSGRFPMNVSYPLVKKYDGDNDGLVSKESMKWGSGFTLIPVHGKRGVTHADMIDLGRENIPGFDIRSFYIELISGLREKGY